MERPSIFSRRRPAHKASPKSGNDIQSTSYEEDDECANELFKKPIIKMFGQKKSTFEEIYKCADQLRDAGNLKFKFCEFRDAIERYKKAVGILDDILVINRSNNAARAELKFKLFSNLALCHLRLKQPDQALMACKSALKPGMPAPQNGKVYYRCAEACFLLWKYHESEKYIGLALKLQPNDFQLLMFQRQILYQVRKEEREKDKLYRKMSSAIGLSPDSTSSDNNASNEQIDKS